MDNTNKKQKAAFGRETSTRAKQLAKARLRQRKLAEEASERNDSDRDTIKFMSIMIITMIMMSTVTIRLLQVLLETCVQIVNG